MRKPRNQPNAKKRAVLRAALIGQSGFRDALSRLKDPRLRCQIAGSLKSRYSSALSDNLKAGSLADSVE